MFSKPSLALEVDSAALGGDIGNNGFLSERESDDGEG